MKNPLLPFFFILALITTTLQANATKTDSTSSATELTKMNSAFSLKAQTINADFSQKVTPRCLKVWTGFTSTTNDKLLAKALKQKIELPKECVDESRKWTSDKLVFEIQTECAKEPVIGKSQTQERGQSCGVPLVQFRAALIDQMTRPTPPQTEDVTKMPANLLATKLFARFFVGLGYDPHDPDAYCQGLLGPITELVKRQPESYSLARGLVAIESIRFAFTKTTRTLEEREKSLNAALAHAEQINAHDEDLKEAHWFILMDREDHAAIENTVHKDLTENPNSKIGLYYSAFLLWKKNDHLQSMILLEKANTLYPEDGRIKDTLNKAQIAKSDENPFQYKINFDLF